MYKKLLQRYLILLICLLSVINLKAQIQGSRPNIVVILADDLGYGDVGFNRDASFPAELGAIPTPHLDNLATDGIIIKNAHVAHPFCGPSRVSIMSGIYSHRIGAQYNLPNDITTTLGPDTNETYFPKILQNSNYNTAAFGKWHLGFVDGSYQPLDRGFDYFFGFLGGGKEYFENSYETNFYNTNTTPWTPKGTVTNEYKDPLWRNRGYVDYTEFSNLPNEDYLTDLLTDEAIAYATANAPSSDPYFMYLSYNAPHTPLQAPDAERAQFLVDNPNFYNLVRNSAYMYNANQVNDDKMEKAVRDEIGDTAYDALSPEDQAAAILAKREETIEDFTQKRITYATMVSNLDTNIGRLIDALDNDITEFNNTLIIFLSDNGGYTYSKGAVNYPLDALKGSVKEGGHKVPMFIHWPNQISAPSTSNHQVSALDLYPTLVNLAGGTIPATKTLDGVNFMDAILAGNDPRPDKSLAIIRPYFGFHNGGMSMGQWKIVKTGGNGAWRLYNILTDPGETTDLRATEPNAEAIIQEFMNQGVDLVKPFKDVKPAWYDNDGDGSGHPHLALWNNGTLPAYNKFFESSLLLLDEEINKISITAVTNAIEGETDGVFNVSLPEGVLAEEDIVINYSITGDALNNGDDYTMLAETVTILNGTNNSDIIISAIQDGIDEISETVTIQLDATTVGSVDTNSASISIFDVIVPTNLTAGDVAIVGWKAEGTNNGAVSFMLLKDITATTKLSISNRVWTNASGFIGNYSVDDVWTWTAGKSFYVGDVFKLDSDGLIKQVSGDLETIVGTTSHDVTGKTTESSDGDFDLSTGGDSVLIYQVYDTFAEPTDANSTAWIAGLTTNGVWGTGGGNTHCELPTALTIGLNAVQVGNDQDNGVYNGKIEGDAALLRTTINNNSNWETSETTNYNLWPFNKTVSSIEGDIGSTGTLSVLNEELEKNINVYPNPAQNKVKINLSSKLILIEANLTSVSGLNVKSNISDVVYLEDVSTGIYFLNIKTNKGSITKKIIKL
ncbi:Por secretion system C-terminal sorting domain-containing protein [Lutibacter oricola]|uniref:Por secretion system C-terminal sorting domain-containing protein n=1 Tax=Lutibacter oricola TaxID=762486 RepID=A0A1H2XHZ4_9FLAO|nr:sulfatase-like hydrolase/transferase [Lutibacter oricola]SDW92465.1 Por secretion system C-terminal sorting domain-containing protein [Lutibacter oricola]